MSEKQHPKDIVKACSNCGRGIIQQEEEGVAIYDCSDCDYNELFSRCPEADDDAWTVKLVETNPNKGDCTVCEFEEVPEE